MILKLIHIKNLQTDQLDLELKTRLVIHSVIVLHMDEIIVGKNIFLGLRTPLGLLDPTLRTTEQLLSASKGENFET